MFKWIRFDELRWNEAWTFYFRICGAPSKQLLWWDQRMEVWFRWLSFSNGWFLDSMFNFGGCNKMNKHLWKQIAKMRLDEKNDWNRFRFAWQTWPLLGRGSVAVKQLRDFLQLQLRVAWGPSMIHSWLLRSIMAHGAPLALRVRVFLSLWSTWQDMLKWMIWQIT